jgi:hypothetical protein
MADEQTPKNTGFRYVSAPTRPDDWRALFPPPTTL